MKVSLSKRDSGDVAVLKIASENNPFIRTLLAKSFKGHLEGLGLRDMAHFL